MKKLLYTILFALTLATSISACTEELVTPAEQAPGGGGFEDPKGPK